MVCGNVSTLMKVSGGVLLLGCVLQVVGLSTDYWSTWHVGKIKDHSGLWRFCRCGSYTYDNLIDYRCYCLPINEPAWLRIVQALEIVGAVGLALNSFLVILSLGLAKIPQSLRRFQIFCAFFTAVAIITGYVMYGVLVQNHKSIGYSFCLCVIASIVAIICGITLRVDLNKHRRQTQEQTAADTGTGSHGHMCYYTNSAGVLCDGSGNLAYTNIALDHPMPSAPPPYDVIHGSQVPDTPPSYESLKAQGYI